VVVVERESGRPYKVEAVLSAEVTGRPCMDLYGVEPQLHLMSRDARRLACLFEAPDAEAMRAVLRTAPGRQPKRVWAANVYRGPGDRSPDGMLVSPSSGKVLAIAERTFEEPVQFEHIQAVEEGGGWCLTVHGVEHVRSYFAFDRRRMLCLYTAPDVESVRIANRRIGLPFDRIWGAIAIAAMAPTTAPPVSAEPLPRAREPG
jgi:hypothetical protein